MKTASDATCSLGQRIALQRAPRLPQPPRTRLEGPIHLALGLATVNMVWLLLATITQFVPRAGALAGRLRQAPEMPASPAHVLQNLDGTPQSRPVAGPTTPPDRKGQTQGSNTMATCAEPVT